MKIIATFFILLFLLLTPLVTSSLPQTNAKSTMPQSTMVSGVLAHELTFQEAQTLANSNITWVSSDVSINSSEYNWHNVYSLAKQYNLNLIGILDTYTMNYSGSFTLSDWNEAVNNAVHDFSDIVKVWEIWNEPTYNQSYLGYYQGTPEEYVTMLQMAYQDIKSSYPNDIVLGLGGLPLYSGGDSNLTYAYSWTQQVVEDGGMQYCDAISLHAYDYGNYNAAQISFKSYIASYKQLTDKDIWITECGQESENGSSPIIQAQYLNNSFKLFSSLGVKSYIWYELNDNQTRSTTFGLFDINGNPKRAFDTFTNLASPSPTPFAPPKIGVYYYPWYMGEWSINHPNCNDTPVLGQYNSSDLHVIDQHLNWFQQLGIDFIIFSWWGKGSPADTNAQIMVNETVKNYSDIQFFFMVEPFTTGWDEAYNSSIGIYNYTLIYSYLYNTYVAPYNSSYFHIDGKPAIGFYDGPNSRNLTTNGVPNDTRFTLRLIGSFPNDDWEYQVPDPSLSSQPVCRDNEISVCPRYDANGWLEDVNYTQGLYDKQWEKAISEASQGRVNIVMIISWNEYAERTQIEPTYDTTSAFKSNPFYLFNKTKEYIETIDKTVIAAPSFPTEFIYTTTGAVVLMVFVLALLILRKKRSQKIGTRKSCSQQKRGAFTNLFVNSKILKLLPLTDALISNL